MILVSQHYTTGDPVRDDELRRAKLLNESCGLFEKCDYLDGDGGQLTFNELFEHCGARYPGEKCVVANSDIAFHEAVGLEDQIQSGKFVTLTRWEDSTGPNLIGHTFPHGKVTKRPDHFRWRLFSGCQDSWCFIGGEQPCLPMKAPTGITGVDQIIAASAAMAGLFVFNPCLSIRTYHLHESMARGDRSAVCRGLYGYPEVCTSSNPQGWMAFHLWEGSSSVNSIKWTFGQCQQLRCKN
jgi:hypothetical protein